MAASVRLTELTLKVDGGGEISYFGAVLSNELGRIFLCSVEGAESASLASLRSALIRARGGVIVLGMTTKDRGDGDVIEGHKEFDLRRVRL